MGENKEVQPSPYKIVEDVYSVGVIDLELDLFDELMPLPDGTSYNSYLIKGSEKTVLIDTCEERLTQVLLNNLKELNIEKIDYIISNHAEQDHTGALPKILEEYPQAIILTNEKAKNMIIRELKVLDEKFKVVNDHEKISLGNKTLEFIFAPWVHWPETMFTYLIEDKIIFTCDLFGAHLANTGFVESYEQIYLPAKRYYAQIMMPFANFVKSHIEKLNSYEIQILATSHGPVYKDPNLILDLYKDWISKKIENKVIIPYVSMHGNTKEMVDYFKQKLDDNKIESKVFDITKEDIGDIVIECMNSLSVVLASSSYLGGLHPQAANFLYLINGFKPNFLTSTIISSHNWGSAITNEFKEKTKNLKYDFLEPVEVEGSPDNADKIRIDSLVELIKEKIKNPNIKGETKMVVENTQSKKEILPKLEESYSFDKDISIVLAGEAGQGIQTIQQALTHLFILEGYNVYTTKEYMSRVRGGSNSVQIRVSSKKVSAPLDRIDILIPLDKNAIPHLENKITQKTIIIGDKNYAKDYSNFVDIAFEKISQNLFNNKIYANTIAISTIMALFEGNHKDLDDFLIEKFSKKGQKIIDNNLEAVKEGFKLGTKLKDNIQINISKNIDNKKNIMLSGTDAIGMGAIAGGCNFISSYPMSPSTGVLVFLASHSKDFKITLEQVEDEISAINMALGASYAGARSMITTSGGGLALMSEGVSLAGIIETPLVLHIAQRPGPATGLPTRTGQEDLNLALNSGHGEFPRMIFAPGSLEDGFYLMQRAFNMAEKYQIPVFVLTDQYYVDTYYNTKAFDITKLEVLKTFIKSDEGYKRYEYCSDGVSPRAIPGFGEGLVCADSDEHDQTGHITEDSQTRIRMHDKRLKKEQTMIPDILEPTIIGDKNDYEYAIFCWGSTLGVVKEAVEEINTKNNITIFHYTQVFPLHPKTAHYVMHAKKSIVIESNATSQFSELIASKTNAKITERILKYDGLQFTVEQVKREILKRI